MSVVQQLCEDLEKDCRSYPDDIANINHRTDSNMQEAVRNRSLWQKFWHWVERTVAWAEGEIAKVREIYERVRTTIEKEILPFVFAPYYLDRAGDDFAKVARDTAALAGRMADGQIQPQAGWSGVGYQAYATTRSQQEAAAKVTGRSVQMLSSQLHTVSVQQVRFWETLIAAYSLFIGDTLNELAGLLDIKTWTEVIPTVSSIANNFRHAVSEQLDRLKQYMAGQVPLMDDLNSQIMSSNELAGGSGWPRPAAAMTQPATPGEPPTWDDGDSGPNEVG